MTDITTNATSDDELKTGRRHSGADQKAINDIVEAAIFLGSDHPRIAAVEPAAGEWKPDEKSLLSWGDEVKALEGGRVRGYLVRFGNENEPDLSTARDWFHAKTYFGARSGDGVDTTLNHGIPLVSDGDPKTVRIFENAAAHILPPVKTSRDEIGLIAETVLNLADEYDAMVYDLASKGKLRWSSGAVGHLVKRTPMANGTNRVDQWVIGEAALTPTPAEPRLGNVVPFKTWADSFARVEQPAPNGAQTPAPIVTPSQPSTGNTNMTDQTPAPAAMAPEYAAKLETLLASVGAITGSITSLTATVDAMKKAPVESAPGIAGIIASGQAPAIKTIHETMHDEQLAALKGLAERTIGRDAWRAHNMKLDTVQADVNRAWSALVHDPVNPYKRHEYEQALKATMVTTAGSLGANLIPNRYSNQLVGSLMEQSIMRMAGATIMTVEGTQSFNVPGITRSGSAPLTTENAANTQMEPTFTNVEFKPYAYRAEYRATREQLGDTRIPMESLLMTNAGWQLTQSENNHFGAGTGASQPQGINQATTAVSAGSALTGLTMDHLIDLQHSVPYTYRPQSAWFMSDGVAKQVRKLRDGGGGAASTGQYLWQPSVVAGQPDRLLNAPVYTLNSMASSGSASNVVVFGAPAFFWVADFNNAGVDFQILNELYAASAAVGWWFWKRIDSHIIVSEAFRGLRLV